MQPLPIGERVKVVVAVVLAGWLRLRVRGTDARGAIQRLHGRGPDREQQLGRQMLRAAAACSLPARSLITVPQPRPVCAPRSRAAAPPHPGPEDPAGLAAAAAAPSLSRC